MKQGIVFLIIVFPLLSCNEPTQPAKTEKVQVPIEGTWELISGTAITKGDTTFTDYTKGQKMIKIINATHFAFLKHDLSKGKDTAIYESGGGTYSLVGNQYTEHLDYCNYREWEGHEFQFTVAINNDTLIQTGLEKLENLGIDRVIIEKYSLVRK